MEEITNLQSWLQIGTSTGFVGLTWYLIVIALPKMQEKFDSQSTLQLQEFRSEIKNIFDRHEKQLEIINVNHEKQLQFLKTIKNLE
jgi:hypothetical protein